jgi:hypothetical protein
MAEQRQDLSQILTRLERVEKENRRLKRAGLAVLVLAGVVLLMGQARPNRTEAERFVLKDASGRMRASLGVTDNDALLTLYGPQGGTANAASAFDPTRGVLAEIGSDQTGGFVILTNQQAGAKLRSDGLTFSDKILGPRLVLSTDLGGSLIFLSSTAKALDPKTPAFGAALFGGDDLLSLNLIDKDGYRLQLGRTDLVTSRTGETHRTSAASLVMFGKDGKILWAAP